MAYHHYFINETKKQILQSKVLLAKYEDGQALLAYLALCVDDTIRIVGEDYGWEFRESNKDYKYINLNKYIFYTDNTWEDDSLEVDKMSKDVFGE